MIPTDQKEIKIYFCARLGSVIYIFEQVVIKGRDLYVIQPSFRTKGDFQINQRAEAGSPKHRRISLNSVPRPTEILNPQSRDTKLSIHSTGIGHIKDNKTNETIHRALPNYLDKPGINDFYIFSPPKITMKKAEQRHLRHTCFVAELPVNFEESVHALINKLGIAEKDIEPNIIADYLQQYPNVIRIELPHFDLYWSHEIHEYFSRKGLCAWVYFAPDAG